MVNTNGRRTLARGHAFAALAHDTRTPARALSARTGASGRSANDKSNFALRQAHSLFPKPNAFRRARLAPLSWPMDDAGSKRCTPTGQWRGAAGAVQRKRHCPPSHEKFSHHCLVGKRNSAAGNRPSLAPRLCGGPQSPSKASIMYSAELVSACRHGDTRKTYQHFRIFNSSLGLILAGSEVTLAVVFHLLDRPSAGLLLRLQECATHASTPESCSRHRRTLSSNAPRERLCAG